MTTVPPEQPRTGRYGRGNGEQVPTSLIVKPRVDGMVDVLHHPVERFYELTEDGMSVGLFIYEQNPSRTSITHVMVRGDRRGLGLSTILIASALDHLAQSGANILVYCDAVADFLHKNPDYMSRVNPSARAHARKT